MTLKLIKNQKQYVEYCNRLEALGEMSPTKDIKNEMDILDLIIEKYHETHFKIKDIDPISFLKELMETHEISQQKLADDLGISKSTMSLILGYKRGLSKDIIRKLADMFKMRHEAFNRPYKLYVSYTPAYLKTMNTKKKFVMTT